MHTGWEHRVDRIGGGAASLIPATLHIQSRGLGLWWRHLLLVHRGGSLGIDQVRSNPILPLPITWLDQYQPLPHTHMAPKEALCTQAPFLPDWFRYFGCILRTVRPSRGRKTWVFGYAETKIYLFSRVTREGKGGSSWCRTSKSMPANETFSPPTLSYTFQKQNTFHRKQWRVCVKANADFLI